MLHTCYKKLQSECIALFIYFLLAGVVTFCVFIMAARQLCWPLAIMFHCEILDFFLLFSQLNLRGRSNFAQLRDLIANISQTQQDIVNQKMALQTMDILAQAELIIGYTLVPKWRKIGQEF